MPIQLRHFTPNPSNSFDTSYRSFHSKLDRFLEGEAEDLLCDLGPRDLFGGTVDFP